MDQEEIEKGKKAALAKLTQSDRDIVKDMNSVESATGWVNYTKRENPQEPPPPTQAEKEKEEHEEEEKEKEHEKEEVANKPKNEKEPKGEGEGEPKATILIGKIRIVSKLF